MIFRSAVYAMVVVAVASAAVIGMPNITTTHTPFAHETIKLDDSDAVYTTVKPADMISTVKPADMNATMKPADKITTEKPAAPAPAQAPVITCYCNLPECSAAAGGDGTCSTRLGCYSEVQPIIPGIEEEIMTPIVTELNQTANASSVSPITSESVEFSKAPVVATTEHAAAIRGSFGCLDQLNFAKQSCDEILKSMEAESSEFPIMQVPTNGAAPSAANFGVHAFHCCQTERCNGNQSGPAEGSVRSAQAVLVAALKNAVAPHPGVQNSTVGVPWTPAVKSSVNSMGLFNTKILVNNIESSNVNTSVNNVELSNTNTSVNNVELSNTNTSVNNVELSNTNTSVNNVEFTNIKTSVNDVEFFKTKTSVNDVELSNNKNSINDVEMINAKKTNAATSDLWLGYFSSLGEPKAPSPLKSDTVFENASLIDSTTPAVPAAMPPTVSIAEPVSQEIVANVEHVVTKRHDGQKAVPVLKQTIDDQENIADFDDDIAAEVAAVAATAKSQEMAIQQPTVSSGSDSWSPRHSGVPDFIPPPSLKKKNITTNSISVTRGVNDNSNSYNTNVIIIITIVIVCTIGLSLCVMFVLRIVARKYDVFRNYKSVCSNPGQPCACTGGLTRGRPRTQPSSSHLDAAAAAVNRKSCSVPLLPTPNPGHKYRGHANAGASYNDAIGDTTYVFTPIPAIDHVAPVRVVRR